MKFDLEVSYYVDSLDRNPVCSQYSPYTFPVYVIKCLFKVNKKYIPVAVFAILNTSMMLRRQRCVTCFVVLQARGVNPV